MSAEAEAETAESPKHADVRKLSGSVAAVGL
jgi:hypothetical protein